jgi:hypothetical protein
MGGDTMYEWRVETVSEGLEAALNKHEWEGWEIFSVVPTLKFENTKVVMATVSLPKQIEYNIVMRKRKSS